MDSYRFLSTYYNRFTQDVGYEKWVDYFEQIFEKYQMQPQLVLDLACGTGTICREMALRGYEMIGVDASTEMLMEAMNQTLDCHPRPIFLNQRMQDLDLYGTVQAVLCCLDSINYLINPEDLARVFARVSLFLEPDGVFIFDINTHKKFESMNGQVYVREDETVFCVWQASFADLCCTYEFDIFEQEPDGRWERFQETHQERYYAPEMLYDALESAGFDRISAHPPLSFGHITGEEDRIFIIARKRKESNG